MTVRVPLLYLTLAVLPLACAGDRDSGAMEESEGEAAVGMDDAAAVAAITDEFVAHYNLHHASMVADLYKDDGIRLNANGSIDEGREAIAASLEATMAAAPVLSVTPADQKLIGDWAVTRGTYSVDANPEGMDAVTYGGSYLSVAEKVDGEWKIALTITNYDAPRPEGWAFADPGEAPDEVMDGPFADLISGYQTHYNLGHPSMVADYYADDAAVAFADSPMIQGRAAIEAALEQAMVQGSPQLEVHNAGTWDLGDGWYIDGGWYEVTASTPDGERARSGTYVTLASIAEDGTATIHWMVTNGWPADM